MFIRFSNPRGSAANNIEDRSHFGVNVTMANVSMTTDDTFANFYIITNFVVIPVVSLLGISGNVVSMIILHKHGFNKHSNVLLFALAVADTTYLVGITNVPLLIYHSHVGRFGFFYSETASMMMYVLYQTFVFLETVGKVVSLLLPVLIISERILVVFWPLHVSRLLTFRRVRAAAALLYPLGIPPYVLFQQTQKYIYTRDPVTGTSFGLMESGATVLTDVINVVTGVYSTLCGPVSVAVVVVGFTLVGVKIHLQAKHRRDELTHFVPVSKHRNNLAICWKCLSFSGKTRTDSYELSPTSRANMDSKQEIYSLYSIKVTSFSYLESRHVLAQRKNKNVPDILQPGEDESPRARESTATTTVNNTSHSKPGRREATKGMRTTKIILSVCVVYSLTACLSFIADMFLNSENLGFTKWAIFHRNGMIALSVNSTVNFIIYVGLNRNFRETYKQLFCRCFHQGREGHP